MAIRQVLTILAGCIMSMLGVGCGEDAKPADEETTYTLTISAVGDGTNLSGAPRLGPA